MVSAPFLLHEELVALIIYSIQYFILRDEHDIIVKTA